MTYNQNASVFKTLQKRNYDPNSRVQLYNAARDSLDLIQRLNLLKSLTVHRGCVNTLSWNDRGNLLLSGSDDQHLVVTHGHTYKVLSCYRTSHRANIFSARFLPNSNDTHIVSCSGDGVILYTDLNRPSETFYNHFLCHSGTTYEVVTIPNDPNSFISCGDDGTVRWFDLRIKTKCKKLRCTDDVMITCRRPVTALCVNPILPYELAVGCSDGKVRTFDRRTLGTMATGWTEKQEALKPISCFMAPYLDQDIYKITSLSYSPDAQDLLVSYSSDYLYLFGVKDPTVKRLSEKCRPELRRNIDDLSVRKVRKLRLRGDWSDTGPDARPEREAINVSNGIGQARPQLQATLMQRMTDVLTRMLNDPQTRAALSGGGENSLDSPRRRRPHVPNSNANGADNPVAETSEGSSQYPIANEEQTQEAVNSIISVEPNEETVNTFNQNTPSTSTHENNVVPPIPDIEMAETQQQNAIENTPINIEINNSSVIQSSGPMETDQANVHSTRKTDQSNVVPVIVSKNVEQNNPILELSENSDIDNSEPRNIEQTASTSRSLSSDESNDRSRESEDVMNSDSEDEPTRDYNLSQIEEEFTQNMIGGNIGGRETYFNETDTTMPGVKKKFTGHRNARTMIKEATFYGNNYIMSGSDCGHIFVWDRFTGKIVMLLQGDQHVVNCIQPHPTLPLLATSGIDYDVKFWAPTRQESGYDEELINELTKRNEIMLEETRDTITVPAAFMIRMLACLNQIRRGGPRTTRNRTRDDEEMDMN